MRCDKRRTVLLEWLMGMWVRLQTVKGNQPCRSFVFRDFVRVMTMTRRRDSSSFFFLLFCTFLLLSHGVFDKSYKQPGAAFCVPRLACLRARNVRNFNEF